jgi:oxygen-independent coproporphyrinogen-3 oxidase
VIERLLCDFRIDPERFDDPALVASWIAGAAETWDGAVVLKENGALEILPDARHLARMIAMEFDGYAISAQRHSAAI